MNVTYLQHIGTDLTVVNAARVSFGKTSSTLTEADKKLIRYLATHHHWSPFAHCSVTLHIKAPIFVARQLAKHQVGFAWNEISRRYVSSDPTFYTPPVLRAAPPTSIKQGSSDIEIQVDLSEATGKALEEYKRLLSLGVAPEEARVVLPQNMMTEWWWTGSLYAFSRMYLLRTHASAQKETGEIARKVGEILSGLYPESWKALVEGGQ